MLSFLYLFIAGLLGGFIAGLIGIGGGVIYIVVIPLALRHFGVPENEIVQYTVANSIFAILFASTSANIALIKLDLFYKKEVMIIGASSVVASLLTLHFVVHTKWYSVGAFNTLIVGLMAYMIVTTLRSAKKVLFFPLDSLKQWRLNMVGVAGGSIAALSGLGGGVVIIPILNSMLKIEIKKASSISSGVIMITAFVMTIYSLFKTPSHIFHPYTMGYIVFPVALTLALGVVIASPFGVRTARKLQSSTISYIYASFLAIVIVKKIVELVIVTFL